MYKLIQTALNRPVTVLMFYIGLILLGALSLRDLAIDLFPPLEFPEITVYARLPDALPEEIEQNITRPLEEAIASVNDIKEIISMSYNGESVIKVKLAWGTDMKYAAIEIRQQVDRVFASLPQDAERPIIMQHNPQDRPIITLALSSGDIVAVGRFAEYVVKRRLEQIQGIAEAVVLGAPEREIRVLFDPDKITALGFTHDAIKKSLAENNLLISGGSIKKGNFRIALRVESEYRSIEEISETPIFPENGRPVPLKKIAEIIDGFKEEESITRINSNRCIALDLRKESGGNTVQISKKVYQVLDELRVEYPDVTFELVYSQADFIQNTINSVIQAILLGSFLAFLILFLFLKNWRAPVIIAVSIPLSIMAAFLLMKFSGISLNIISLSGLALGSGMLVDNSIVVLENIHRRRDEGLSFFEAALKGTHEVALPITASTITTIAVFIPVIFLKDLSGAIFTQQAKTVSYALMSSLFVALTLLPVLYLFFHRKRKPSELLLPQQNIMKGAEDYYQNVMTWCLQNKRLFLVSVSVLFIVSLLLSLILDRRLLPEAEQHALSIMAKYQPGVSLDFIDRTTAELESKLNDDNRVQKIYAQLGRKPGAFVNPNERKLNRASLYLTIDDNVSSNRVISDYQDIAESGQRIQYHFMKEQTALSQLLGTRPNPLNIDITGENLYILDSLAQYICKSVTDKISGTNFFEKYPVIILEIDRKKVIEYGLSAYKIINEIKLILEGETVTTFREFDKKIDIIIRGVDKKRNDLSEILNTRISNYPIKTFVKVHYKNDLNMIERKNQNRLFQINLSRSEVSLNQLAVHIEKIISSISLPPGYRIQLSGEWLESFESLKVLFFASVLAIILVYLILAAQFESFQLPFIILFTIPLAIIGIIPALLLTGMSLNIMSGIGLVVITGIVVNDGIIKIGFISQAEKDGATLIDAIHQAGKTRLRPILMTTITTVLGLLPLALGIGPGSELQQPMAITIIGGISVSTLLTLFVLPVLYVKLK